jgi:broad specificity phosphatase PhoE
VSTTQILLVRHPQTEANVDLRYVGSGDTPLTEEGRRQAAALVQRVVEWKPSALVTSPSQRCLEVSTPAAEALGLQATVLEELAEMDFGLAEGLTYDEVARAGISLDLLGGPVEAAPFEGGEAWGAFAARVAAAADIVERTGDRVGVVTHGGVIRALVTHWLGLPDEAAWRFAIPPAGVVEIAVEDGHGVLVTLGA